MDKNAGREISDIEINSVTGAAHCGFGVTTGNGGGGFGFWYDGNEDGQGVTVGLRVGGGFAGPGFINGQDPFDPLFIG